MYIRTCVCMHVPLDVYQWEVNAQQLLVDMHITHETGMHFCNGTCKDHPNANNTNMTCMCMYVRMCTYSTHIKSYCKWSMIHCLSWLAYACHSEVRMYVRMYCTVRTTYVHTYVRTNVRTYVHYITYVRKCIVGTLMPGNSALCTDEGCPERTTQAQYNFQSPVPCHCETHCMT